MKKEMGDVFFKRLTIACCAEYAKEAMALMVLCEELGCEFYVEDDQDDLDDPDVVDDGYDDSFGDYDSFFNLTEDNEPLQDDAD